MPAISKQPRGLQMMPHITPSKQEENKQRLENSIQIIEMERDGE
jgi:hypothetical protein